jgi:hypothetical protein
MYQFIYLLTFLVGCSKIFTTQHKWYSFPEHARFEEPSQPYKRIGIVRSKVNFTSLDDRYDETTLCKNYFNKAIADLVKMAKDKGADAVVRVRSVVFLGNGVQEFYTTAECADDGIEGQILAEGIAINWSVEQE